MNELLKTLQHELGDGVLYTGEDVGDRHAVDTSGENRCMPPVLLKPSCTEEVSTILQKCHAENQPLALQGGMTGLAGGSTPQPGEFAISSDKLNGIEEIDHDSMTLTAYAGTPLQVIQEAAESAGLFFPLDFGSRGSCTIGGVVATNAGGNQVIRYGMARELILGLKVVLADGTILNYMNKVLKNNSGYDLKHLFIGSEGTLGFVTKVVLRLYSKPSYKHTALCAVNSFEDILKLYRNSNIALAGNVSAFEVMWKNYFDFIMTHVGELKSPFNDSYPFTLLLEYQGVDSEEDKERFQLFLCDEMESGRIADAVIAQSLQDAGNLWAIRDGIGDAVPLLSKSTKFDISIPGSQMSAFVEDMTNSLEESFSEISILIFGHIGDGNLHVCAGTANEDDKKKIYQKVYAITEKYDGAISAEHGVGTLKRQYLCHSRGEEEIRLMRSIKDLLDPKKILNGGRIF